MSTSLSSLPKRIRRDLRLAVLEAVESYESLVDAHSIEWNHSQGKNAYLHPKVVPVEHRAQVAKWKKQITRWKRLSEALRCQT